MNKQQPIVDWTWREKYRYVKPDGSSDEETIYDTNRRVVKGVYAFDEDMKARNSAITLMDDQVWCPAGRIHAGAGTPNAVTLINCYVSPTIQDSMRTHTEGPQALPHSLGIGDSLLAALYTQQMGGGIGMDFSTLRPNGAVVKRTNSVSTGPLPFMDMWNAMCSTVKSSGSRRGAMMGVLRCDHPDIFEFVLAKQTKGRFTNFNVSVLVTDAFMYAVEMDREWDLVFPVPPAKGIIRTATNKEGSVTYVYRTVRARDLWNAIIQNTYNYAEPGVIYIDKVNNWNNLWYCETISATNPCGEQPLPPDGACNLGANNLAALVQDPFLNPIFDIEMLKLSTRVGMRFLDNVLDVSQYPTKAQELEATQKRRTGLGITGLGNALQMMKIRYGSGEAVKFTGMVMETIRDSAYRESIELAKERGPFEFFNRDKYLKGKFIQTLPEDIRDGIAEHGIRNSVLLTIAPTGTTSLYYGNVSSGLEPTFAWKYKRKVLEHDGSFRDFEEVYDYGYLKYLEVTGHKEGDKLPDYMVSAMDLTVGEHLAMQAVAQKYVDASISKTINCPKDMSFEDFKSVYDVAYVSGCKGCTTYRPSDVRGAVLMVEEKKDPVTGLVEVQPRPEMLEGTTYKVKYPGMEEAFYITINDYINPEGRRVPFEIFINSKSVKHQEWVAAFTRMLSAIFRRGGDVNFIIGELSQVHSSMGGAFVNKKYVPSLVAFIGSVIEKHFIKIGLITPDITAEDLAVASTAADTVNQPSEGTGAACPQCNAPTYYKQEGCGKCSSCGYSDCG